MGADRGNLTWARRQWRRDSRPVCKQCKRPDPTGLIDGLCTHCFCNQRKEENGR